MRKSAITVSRPLLLCAIIWMSGMMTAILIWKTTVDFQVGNAIWVCVCVGAAIIFLIAEKGKIEDLVNRYGVVCLIFGIGAILMQMFLHEHQPYSIGKLNFSSHNYTIEAKVESNLKPTRSQNSLQASLQVVRIKELKLINCTNLHALLIVPKSFHDKVVQPGQFVQIVGTLKKITATSANGGLLDPIRRLNDAQVIVFINASQSSKTRSLENSIKIIQTPVIPQNWVRDLILSKLESVTSSQDVTFLAGLLFGVTDRMDPSLQQAYTVLGISHILAVSGMNIELLIRPCLWTLRKVRVGYRVSASLMICMVIGYGLLTAGGASVVRAVITGVTMLAAGLFKRKADPLSALSVSCIVCLWVDPSNLANVGFQFSFLASLFLILFSSYLGRFLKRYRIPFSAAIAVFTSATAATLPIQLYVFQQWSPYSILTNLLLEPFMPICMVTMLVTIIVCFLCWPFAVILGAIMHGIVWLLTKPILWLFHSGVPILQLQQNEAIWSFAVYGVVAVCLVWSDRHGKSMHTILGSGKDRSTDFIR